MLERGGELGEVVGDAMPVRIHTAQERGPARRAQRRRRERIPEVHTFVGDAIDLGRANVRMTGIPGRIPAEIVEQDDQDVGVARRLCPVLGPAAR